MDPRDLKKLFDEKKAATRAADARAKSVKETQQAEFERLAQEGHAALRDVVVPYLQKVSAEFLKGEFEFEIQTNTEGEIVGAWFRVGKGSRHGIEAILGRVTAYKVGDVLQGMGSRRKAEDIAPKWVFPSEVEPFIGKPSELTTDKIWNFVKMAIEET
jgi:hypothetical protein